MYIKCFHPLLLIRTKYSLMEKSLTEMDIIDEWELLLHKNSHIVVQESVLPSQAMEEEEVLSLESNIKQQDLSPIQPNFQATEEEVVEDEHGHFSNYEKQSEDNGEEEIGDEQPKAFESENISFTEEEEEEMGKMVEYTDPESKEKNGYNAFRLRTWLRSAGLAAATFSIFILQKSMPKNHKIMFKISKNEKPKQLFQHQQEVSEPLAATTRRPFSGHYDMWY